MCTLYEMPIELAKCFSNSKVRKRFLKQMLPLRDLLEEYGLESRIVDKTKLYIKGNGKNVIVAHEEGERCYGEMDQIFCVCKLDTLMGYHVRANQSSGVIRTLVRWGVLDEDEIPDDRIQETNDQGSICCENCSNPQMFCQRFKQCRLCHDMDRNEGEPGFNGFYCGKQCQIAHWSEHKRMFH